MTALVKFIDVTYRFLKNRQPKGWAYSCMEEYVLKNGRHWTPAPRPADVPLMPAKECFKNATLLALERSDLTYVEGYAVGIIPVLHAWCVDKEGRVVDPTWPKVGSEYFGVPFDRAWLFKEVQKMNYYGVLDDWRRTYPLLRKPAKGVVSKQEWPGVSALDR